MFLHVQVVRQSQKRATELLKITGAECPQDVAPFYSLGVLRVEYFEFPFDAADLQLQSLGVHGPLFIEHRPDRSSNEEARSDPPIDLGSVFPTREVL